MSTGDDAPDARSSDPASHAQDNRGMGRRAARGAFVTLGGQGIRIVLQVGGVVVLARLLSPSDYGLIAMVTAVTGIGELFRDFGLSAAAIQAKSLSVAQRTNLFWLNSGIGALLCALTASLAVPISHLYDEPDLVPVVHALAFTFLFNGMATQFRADLSRRMEFTRLAAVDVISAVVALTVAIGMALAGAGFWALVAQQLTAALVLLVSVAVLAPWRPGMPRRHVPMRGLLSFGWNLLATQLVGYAGNNVDSLTIGVRFGAVDLGLYNRAYQLLMSTLSQLRAPTTTVALPVLARLQDDPVRFADFVRRGQLALAYGLVAALAFVAAAAEPLTDLLLGPQWLAATPLIRFLAIAGAFQTLAYVGYWVYLARGLTAVLLRYTLVSSAIKIVCVVVGSTWGVVGVAAGFALAPALSWPLSLWWLSRHAPVQLGTLIGGALRTLATFATCGAAAYLVSAAVDPSSPWIAVGIQAVVYVGLLAGVCAVVPALRRDVRDVVVAVRLATRRG
ncbi:lipopolysaccharide biosynthesis protein [Cellulomonas xylanilytica]|uniref:Lipopolysaccharide biosynthesis protein n=1 Tax=Cellulomonas xylanilytica TaxID=233583 RepID=A0A510V363_9CELL|nr:lipopolysaccharide biosynthesis protein [Cellulomonas xylanilytica]GEK21323.1 lipopolysaccharide biosynthesis protein [Cellulomonas xylanilytica]